MAPEPAGGAVEEKPKELPPNRRHKASRLDREDIHSALGLRMNLTWAKVAAAQRVGLRWDSISARSR